MGKLLVLELVLAARLQDADVRSTASLSRELRDCWREIEELTAGDDAGGEVDADELAERRARVAAARSAASQAAQGS